MNKHLTEIAYILDRSGSMAPMVEPAITGFNQFLKDQAEAPGEARLTLVLFDNEYLVPCQGLPIAEVTELDTTTYVPRGSTALLDAIGRTIDELGKKLGQPFDTDDPLALHSPKGDEGGQVIVAIFTDGYENASTDYTLEKINKMITHQRNTYNWQFLFLAANEDAIATAAHMGIDHAMASKVRQSRAGVGSSSASFSRKIRAMRHYSVSDEKTEDYLAPMDKIVDEEQDKAETRNSEPSS